MSLYNGNRHIDEMLYKSLNPCKLCNDTYKPFVKVVYHGSLNGNPTGYWCGCECYNYTKLCDTRQGAINAWNKCIYG